MGIENLNRILYTSRDFVKKTIKRLNLVLSVVALFLLIYAYGFYHEAQHLKLIFTGIEIIFAFFCVDYLLDLLYSFERKQFLKETWLQGLLIALIIYNGIGNLVFDNNVLERLFLKGGFSNYVVFYYSFITLYMLVLIVFEFTKSVHQLKTIKLNPATIFLFSFIFLILCGAFLLMLPRMTMEGRGLSFLDAIFTATSAACVTGLTVVNTATHFTIQGHVVILILMQLGGLGVLSFTTFFATFLSSGMPLRQQSMLMSFTDSESLSLTRNLLRQIVFLTILIEIIGSLLVFLFWGNDMQFDTLGDKVFYSVFHSVSAFCNAGFSILPDGLHSLPIRKSYLLHLVLAVLIIFGGLGFSVIVDLFSPSRLRERLKSPWKNWRVSTIIVVYASMALIVFGTLLFLILELDQSLSGMKKMEALLTAFFQSVTARTAGFNTVDFSLIGTPALIIMLFLMFIGASPGSTGGGIKTTTFVVLLVSAWATITGQKNMEIAHRRIDPTLVNKAFSIFFFAATYLLVAIFLLSIFEPHIDILKLVFEAVSAFCTVGLSTGITPSLSPIGKIIVILSMYIGRVGTLTLAIALASQSISNTYKYPNAHIMVG